MDDFYTLEGIPSDLLDSDIIEDRAFKVDLSRIDNDTPLPVKLKVNDVPLTHETDIVTQLCEISNKLSILIKYEAMLHKVDLEEDL